VTAAHITHVAVPDHQPCSNGCTTGHGPDRTPIPCEGRARICSKCLDRLDTTLRQIPDTYALLPDVTAHGTVSAAPGKRTKRADPPAPYRLIVRDLLDTTRITQNLNDPHGKAPIISDNRRGAFGIVHGWAQAVRDERHLVARPVQRMTVASECALIGSHLAWCSEQHWASDLYDELRTLARHLADAVGDYRPRPVGMCMAMVLRPPIQVRQFCGGALYQDRTGHGVHCSACGDRKDPARLFEIGRSVGMFSDNETQEAS
jgi:hypothetical protein